MSRIFAGLIGAAVAATCIGAVEFIGIDKVFAQGQTMASVTESVDGNVNRSGKSDPLAVASTAEKTRTVGLKLEGLADTTILVRLPNEKRAANATSAPKAPSSVVGSSAQRRPVACEPVVSVLTDVAKQLSASRCVT